MTQEIVWALEKVRPLLESGADVFIPIAALLRYRGVGKKGVHLLKEFCASSGSRLHIVCNCDGCRRDP